MVEHKVLTTGAEIDLSLDRANRHDDDPRAVSVEHIATLNLLIVQLSNQRRLLLAIEDVQGLDAATPARRSSGTSCMVTAQASGFPTWTSTSTFQP